MGKLTAWRKGPLAHLLTGVIVTCLTTSGWAVMRPQEPDTFAPSREQTMAAVGRLLQGLLLSRFPLPSEAGLEELPVDEASEQVVYRVDAHWVLGNRYALAGYRYFGPDFYEVWAHPELVKAPRLRRLLLVSVLFQIRQIDEFFSGEGAPRPEEFRYHFENLNLANQISGYFVEATQLHAADNLRTTLQREWLAMNLPSDIKSHWADLLKTRNPGDFITGRLTELADLGFSQTNVLSLIKGLNPPTRIESVNPLIDLQTLFRLAAEARRNHPLDYPRRIKELSHASSCASALSPPPVGAGNPTLPQPDL